MPYIRRLRAKLECIEQDTCTGFAALGTSETLQRALSTDTRIQDQVALDEFLRTSLDRLMLALARLQDSHRDAASLRDLQRSLEQVENQRLIIERRDGDVSQSEATTSLTTARQRLAAIFTKPDFDFAVVKGVRDQILAHSDPGQRLNPQTFSGLPYAGIGAFLAKSQDAVNPLWHVLDNKSVAMDHLREQMQVETGRLLRDVGCGAEYWETAIEHLTELPIDHATEDLFDHGTPGSLIPKLLRRDS